MYARTITDDGPLRALVTRQLFLFDKEPHLKVSEAKRWGGHASSARSRTGRSRARIDTFLRERMS